VPFETIVVDNGSRDETPEEIARFPWVRYLRHETNRNFAGACNAGARLAEAPITLFLNNDAYPLGDAFVPLVRAFDTPEVAIAGGALFFEDGVTQAAGLALLENAHWHYYCRNLEAPDVTRSRDALAVSGAAMAVRTRWFLDAGAFDESFINGFEDVDLCMRAREEQRQIRYVADARFAHYEAASAGRFDREAENERHFYSRWSLKLAPLPRTARGEVGAIVIRRPSDSNSLLRAALEDLTQALSAFGHPVVDGAIAPWQRLDRRFRRAANLAWFAGECAAPGITLSSKGDRGGVIRTCGAAALEEPWLPCASNESVARCGVRLSHDPSCKTVGIAGGDPDTAVTLPRGSGAIAVTPEMLLGNQSVEVACVVHVGLTDAASFGNVLLAQAGLPTVVANAELARIFAADVAFVRERAAIGEVVAQLAGDPELRARNGGLVAADARRRFSPRRSAIRVVDLLAAARFGLERPGRARSDSPLPET